METINKEQYNKLNRLIAKFMDVEIEDDRNICLLPSQIYVEDLKFNISYDWLVPVIKKIHKVIGVKSIDECTTEEWNIYRMIDELSFRTEIDELYLHVVEFIVWYNKQNS